MIREMHFALRERRSKRKRNPENDLFVLGKSQRELIGIEKEKLIFF